MTDGAPARPHRVCIFGTYDASRHPRIAVLADGLAANGLDVVACNVPWDAPTAARVAALRQPWTLARLALRLVRSWVRLRRRARQLGPVDTVVVGYLGVLDVHLARRWLPGATVVLDHLAPVGGTVEDRTARRGLRARLAARVDAAAVARADLVVVDTDEHAAAIPAGKAVVVAVGAGDAWFAAARDAGQAGVPSGARPLQVVFFGLFTPLQGTVVIAEAIARALDAGAPLQATLVGSGQDLERCRQLLAGRPDVAWHDWVDGDRLPSLVAAADVCLGIFGTTPKALRVVPTKVFQGAAAGCAIVTSDTAPQRRLLGDAALLLPPGDPGRLAEALQRLAGDPAEVARLSAAARALADAHLAAPQVVAPLVARLAAPRPVAERPPGSS